MEQHLLRRRVVLWLKPSATLTLRFLVRQVCTSARTREAKTLPSSTPHWSKELIPQTKPCPATPDPYYLYFNNPLMLPAHELQNLAPRQQPFPHSATRRSSGQAGPASAPKYSREGYKHHLYILARRVQRPTRVLLE